MSQNDHLQVDLKTWMNKIIYIYWFMVGLAMTGQLLGLVMALMHELYTFETYFIYKLVLPSTFQIFVIGLATYFVRVRRMYSPRVLTILGVIAAWITVYTHAGVPGLQVLFVILMAVNLIYFNKAELKFSFLVNIIALLLLYTVPKVRLNASVFESFSYFFMLICAYYVFRLVLDRGTDILNVLKRSAEQERSLMVKSAMMERLTKVDPLTELYNHKTFYEYLDFLYDQSIHYNMPLQLAIIDIDNFKQINDQYGHSVGDVILKRVARIIEENVTENEIVARYGGEEFAVLLTSKSEDDSHELIDTIREKIATTVHDEIQGYITVSVGFQPLNKTLTQELFFDHADDLLYKAKRAGKNCVMRPLKEEGYI